MPYNFAADSFRTKKLCIAYFLQEKSTYIPETVTLCIGLPISDNCTFSLCVTAETLRANIDWKSDFLKEVDQSHPKFQVGHPHQSCFVSQN